MGMYFKERFYSTMARTEHLKKLGCVVHEYWECSARRFLKDHPDLLKHAQEHPISRLENWSLQDSMRGGRTNLFKLYAKAGEDEIISYRDFSSLYPFIQKYTP
jgi:hypothetical protein